MTPAYREELTRRIDDVFRQHPESRDHRADHPWLLGALGDPFSGIWFIGENPSLRQVKRARNPDGGEPTEQAQWFTSKGAKLLREILVRHGFKAGTPESLGGWKCYITNVVKEADYAKAWRDRRTAMQRAAAEAWSEVLRWELEQSRPIYVVAMGDKVRGLLSHIASRVALPETDFVPHYAGIASRPSGPLGPMHPVRVQSYDRDFGRIAKRFRELKGRGLTL